MADRIQRLVRQLNAAELTFGLREAIILAVVACAIAIWVVYLNGR
jgi:hypothetical protein